MNKTAIVEGIVIGGAVVVALGLISNQGKIFQVLGAAAVVILTKGVAAQIAAKV